MACKWTPEQQQVIDIRGKDVLVSAAAGSGKTAVLVERILSMITDETAPVDIGRLLVVTFTNAAAAEMRQRISDGLALCYRANPGNENLYKQRIMLPNAQIMTIDSFCLRLIREHFDVLDIDPSFRLGDESELKLLKADVLSDVLETYYASDNKAYRDFVDCYARGKGDSGISEMVMKVYQYAKSSPWPKVWLEHCRQMVCVNSQTEQLPDNGMLRVLVQEKDMVITACFSYADKALAVCHQTDGPLEYEKVILDDRQQLETIAELSQYTDIREALLQVKWGKLPGKCSAQVTKERKEQVKNIRAGMKACFDKLRKDYFSEPEENIAAELAYIAPHIGILTELTAYFDKKYMEAKEERHMLDFNDLEHLALNILMDCELVGGEARLTYTPTAAQLVKQYDEILCDEYQDSNMIQEMILDSLSAGRFGRHDRFMVGDVKQSIYRFRLADPSIFMDKYNMYPLVSEAEEHPQVKINLHKNFRSRKVVLDAVNILFRSLMTRDFGGIEYDDAAALYEGMVFQESETAHIADKVDVLIVEQDKAFAENEDMAARTAIELEAKAAVIKIRALTDAETGLDVYDSGREGYRRAGYGDIAILMRTVSGWAETFLQVLGEAGIPCFADVSTGFFDTMEIQTMTSLLTVIDNPLQDIPLAAVLMSPVVGITAEELSFIRAEDKEMLYNACKKYAQKNSESKVSGFLIQLALFREKSSYLGIHELLSDIYTATGFYEFVSAMPAGEKRRGNLNMLLEKALNYAATSYKGLFNFVRYIEQLQKREVDFGEALQGNIQNCVRIVSIHKSKGLEYPAVILAGMGKQMNKRDARGTIAVHQTYGIGMDAVNLLNSRKKATTFKRFVAGQIVRDNMAEELRILYVALTRAKEKLILLGMSETVDADIERWLLRSPAPGMPMDTQALLMADNYFDWVMPCLIRTSAGTRWLYDYHQKKTDADSETDVFAIQSLSIADLVLYQAGENAEAAKNEAVMSKHMEKPEEAGELEYILSRAEEWRYKWDTETEVKAKYSVSELKYADEEAAEVYAADGDTAVVETPAAGAAKQQSLPEQQITSEKQPLFMQDIPMASSQEQGAFRGTAYHKVLEMIDYAGAADAASVSGQVARMVKNGYLTAEAGESVFVPALVRFLQSDLGQRMGKADGRHQLFREQQFVMSMPADTADPELHSKEEVLVQGVIDAFFEENGQIIVVDYKTDRVGAAGGDLLKHRYGRQLDFYAEALSRWTGKPVGGKIIYSLSLNQAIYL